MRSTVGQTLTPATNEILEPHPGATCYMAILSKTTRLEQTLVQTASPPRNHDPNLVSLQSTNYHDQPCLASKQPVLLSLALLADNIICTLEDVLRLAAPATHTIDKTSLAGSSSTAVVPQSMG